jgi:Periplasmic binding protein
MRKSLTSIAAISVALASIAVVGIAAASPSGASSPSQGVTATTIRVGIPYVDLSAVRQFGVTLNQGNFPDAYNALIADLNAHGGIDGRRVVPYVVAVDPVGTAPSATACTQLAEDDNVLVAIAPQQPDCYVQQYGIPTIAGNFQNAQATNGAPNFNVQPPVAVYDPLQLGALAHRGSFKGKIVGVFAGSRTDENEMHIVQKALQSVHVHVHVEQSAVDDAPPGDETASNQQVAIISQKFQSAGVNDVVAVGTGGTIWPESLQNNQSSYDPAWMATNEGSLAAAVSGSSIAPKYLKNLVTTSPVPSKYQIWQEPAVQECYRIIRKAYPSDVITPPSEFQSGSDQSSYAVESACTNVALLKAIAKAAGKDLTRVSFAQAGYKVRGAIIPGTGAPVTFAVDRPYAIGPVYLVTYNPAKHALEFSSTPAN